MTNHEGGCVCGAVRYRVINAPARTSACHCRFCQRRTGSAFGIGAYFREADVEILSGELKTYEHRSDETQRWLRSAHPCSAVPEGVERLERGSLPAPPKP